MTKKVKLMFYYEKTFIELIKKWYNVSIKSSFLLAVVKLKEVLAVEAAPVEVASRLVPDKDLLLL